MYLLTINEGQTQAAKSDALYIYFSSVNFRFPKYVSENDKRTPNNVSNTRFSKFSLTLFGLEGGGGGGGEGKMPPEGFR